MDRRWAHLLSEEPPTIRHRFLYLAKFRFFAYFGYTTQCPPIRVLKWAIFKLESRQVITLLVA